MIFNSLINNASPEAKDFFSKNAFSFLLTLDAYEQISKRYDAIYNPEGEMTKGDVLIHDGVKNIVESAEGIVNHASQKIEIDISEFRTDVRDVTEIINGMACEKSEVIRSHNDDKWRKLLESSDTKIYSAPDDKWSDYQIPKEVVTLDDFFAC